MIVEQMTEMNTQIKERWVEELRSGKYKQGKNTLRQREDGGDAFCCLGVLCDILIKNKHIEYISWATRPNGSDEILVYDDLNGDREFGVVPEAACNEIGLDKVLQDDLAKLNDDGMSFEEIADVIEEQA